jgi:hypothetical protein
MFRPTDRDTIDPGATGATILRWVVLATAIVGLVMIAVVVAIAILSPGPTDPSTSASSQAATSSFTR